MKKSTGTLLTIFVSAVLVLTIASSVIGYFAMTAGFDHKLFYFNIDSILGPLYIILPVAACLISLVCGIMLRKKVSFTDIPSSNIPTTFTSTLTGLLMIASAVLTLISGNELSRLSVAAVVFAFVSAVYFIALPFANGKPFMALLSFSPVGWAAFKLLEEYFRDGEPINSPIKTVNLTMFSFLLLFFAEEIRFGIDRQIPGSYYFCILSAVTFTGNAVFPKLAIILTDNSLFEFSVIDWCLYAALFTFLLARLSALPAILGDHTEQSVTTDTPEN